MRKISASYIISNAGVPLKNGILILNDDNSVADIIDRKGSVKEIQDLEYYSGVLVPGFVDVFTFLSWPNMTASQIDSNDLSGLELGESGDIQSIQKAINHLEAFGSKGAADFFPTRQSEVLKANSKISFKDIRDISNHYPEELETDFPNSTLGRLFNNNNIFLNKAFCIGTGSLSSHLKLSVFDELKFLQNLNPNLNLEQLIKWASINGAVALGFDHLGSFEIGKKPGVNLITNLDYDNFCLQADSKLKVLV
tara:strand:- start:13940 stop:14695 length:756 start_codon:yes stop_codon:yes gene_type:complete